MGVKSMTDQSSTAVGRPERRTGKRGGKRKWRPTRFDKSRWLADVDTLLMNLDPPLLETNGLVEGGDEEKSRSDGSYLGGNRPERPKHSSLYRGDRRT